MSENGNDRDRMELIDTLAVGDGQVWPDFWTNAEQRRIGEAWYGAQADAILASSWLAKRTQSTDAWFGAWECGCTDTERTPAGIPQFCPSHGASLISDDTGRTKVQLTHSGVSGYGFRAARPPARPVPAVSAAQPEE